ncbi:hypothetical protein K1719_045237 [Acacia pycnantha]|nr:hypothetical protein K1719_045237 [Acacia pycnantha]
MDEKVPLVIPEVNPETMENIKLGMGKGALIANPNCSTIIYLMATTPLHRRAKPLNHHHIPCIVNGYVVSTYQSRQRSWCSRNGRA